ncbi:Tetratricopeptide-like helical [Penicillium sp. DV-2018c]|nr:Tetratricopeptide-like helical [Penicillium sp. DV-2018c]
MDQTSPADGYYDLGDYRRNVSTANGDAQLWFSRGLIWAYAFNHEESVRCFEKVVELDPTCAMGYWGIAFSLGPNYNKPWQLFDGEDLSATTTRAHRAILEANKHAPAVTPLEKALIDALQHRYPQEQPVGDCTEWDKNYAEAMASVYNDNPDDLDVAALYCDALMNLTPWGMWDMVTGEAAPGAKTFEAKAVLDRVLENDDSLEHPGILHLYIHLMEMSPTPEVALPIAEYLRGLVPDAGHLEHMPSHIDILCGEYKRAVTANTSAIRADEKFLANQPLGHTYNIYRAHDYHFRMYAAMLGGKSKIALETGAELARIITEPLLRIKSPPMADWLEGFVSVQMHGFIRFGRWDDIIALELPADAELFCVTTAMMHYAKGIAFAATNRVLEAEAERGLFLRAMERVPASRTIFNNRCVDILRVGEAMLDGEIAYRRGEFNTAFSYLRDAVKRDDSLPYDEPWGWMQPARHALGALLLEQGYVEEAAAVYSADLGVDTSLPRALRHPGNVWASHGYHECLVKLGRKTEARAMGPHLRKSLAWADVPIKSSCFCRQTTG